MDCRNCLLAVRKYKALSIRTYYRLQPLKFPPKPVRSQKVKELITMMLKVNEKDRLSWDGVFEDPAIKIDEEKIKENMKNILKEKGL